MATKTSEVSRFSLFIAAISILACARSPQFKTMKVGEVVFIKPTTINSEPISTQAKPRAIKLNVMWGGRMLSSQQGETTINLYDAKGTVRYSKLWSEFEESYKTTGCSNEEISALDGSLMGSALICDGSVSLNEIIRIEGVDSKGKIQSATSWGVHAIAHDITAISIGLY